MADITSSPATYLNGVNNTIVGASNALNSPAPQAPSGINAKSNTTSVPEVGVSSPSALAAAGINPSVSSTTLSNANKINQVQQNNNTLNQVSQKGSLTNGSGVTVNANGTQNSTVANQPNVPAGWDAQTYANFKAANPNLEPTPEDTAHMMAAGNGTAVVPTQNGAPNQQPYVTPDVSQEDKATNAILDQLISTTDANTATQIQSIQSSFAVRDQQQSIINAANQKATQNALLMGGVTGQGSSAQFAPISSQGIIQAQESYGIQQLASLDAQENSEIAAARQAQYSNDFQLMEKKLDSINTIRQSKIDLATKINDSAVQTNQDLAKQALQSNVDNAVASVYADGVTDPSKILSQLKKQGTNVSLSQINASLGEIAKRNGVDPSTLDATSKQFFYLKGIGGLPSDISNLPDTASQLAAYVQMVNAALATGKNNFSYGAGINPVVQNTLNLIGGNVTADMTVSQAIATVGLPAIVKAIIGQEGGSPKGVENNPGNIKFVGLPGQTDSGVKATDGGTFASYVTPQAGQDAVGAWVQNKGNTNIADAIATYKGVKNGATTVPGTTGNASIDTSAAGYSSTAVPGAGNLTQAAIDQKALDYVTSGTNPPIGRTGLAGQQNAAISNRMAEIAPGANTAANKAQLKAYSTSLTQQQKYLDTTQRSVENADAGFQQVVNTFQNKGINSSSLPISNIIANKTKYQLGDTDINAFKAGLAEVANEYTQVFSRGGQVSDSVRSKSNEIVNGDLSFDSLKAVMNELQAQGKIVIDGAKNQVSTITGNINNIIAPGNNITSTTHNGINLPSADASTNTYEGITLPN